MTFVYGLLAANSTAPAKNQGGMASWGLWIILGLMFVVMYFVLYRPQKKRAQEAQNMVASLRMGDEVVTIGGIHGTIVQLTDDTIVLEVDEGVRLTFTRSAIARALTVHDEEEEPDEAVDEEEYDEEEYDEDYEEEEYDEEVAEEPGEPEPQDTGDGGSA